MSRIPATLAAVLVPLALIPLALASCSGQRTAATSASVPPAPTGPTTPAATRTATPTDVPPDPPDKPPRTPTPDPVQRRVEELSTGGGVSSLVIRLTGAGTVATPRRMVLAQGQTLRLVVISPKGTHLTGNGLGVDIDVPAGSPTAVDVVSFTAGAYALTTDRGNTILNVTITT